MEMDPEIMKLALRITFAAQDEALTGLFEAGAEAAMVCAAFEGQGARGVGVFCWSSMFMM